MDLRYEKITSIKELLSIYYFYIKKKINQYINDIMPDIPTVIEKNRKNTKEQSDIPYTYIDDHNRIRVKANSIKDKKTLNSKNQGIYVSDDIMYDQVSKIKHMLRRNGYCPLNRLVEEIYMVYKETGHEYTINELKESFRDREIDENISERINRILREISSQENSHELDER